MGFLADIGNTIKERLNPRTIAAEVMETITDRVVPQGAAELAQSLYTGSGYVPYGSGQEPVDPVAAPEPTLQESYDQVLASYVPKERGIEM